ncbi:hypothetical protein ACX93W_07410 [Paenibacillus sp. CAU 1782]
MKSLFGKQLSFILVIAILLATSNSVFAQKQSGTDIVNNFGDFSEKIETISNNDGSLTYIYTISNHSTGDVVEAVVNDDKDSRKVLVSTNGTLEKITTLDKAMNNIEIQDNQGGSFHNGDEFLSSNVINAASDTPSYPYLQSLYHSSLGHWGYLYGENNITYGSEYKIQISTGTAWSTAISVVLAVIIPGATAVGILLALGVSTIGVSIDTAIDGKIYARYNRWDYEVFFQSQLGLKTYQIDIDQRVIDNNTGNITYVDVDEQGFVGTRSDMIYAGVYNVYIFNL